MKNKNGFTLVELLAVIAILAILVIIALPNVMGMFNEAKKSAFTTELKEVYKVAQQTWMVDAMLTTDEQVYSRCDGCTGKSLDLSGRTEMDYYIKFDKAGKMIKYYATDNTYQYEFDNNAGLLVTDIKDAESVASLAEDDIIEISSNEVKKGTVSIVDNAPAGPVSFATDSWETIAYAVRNNNTSAYNVGDTKSINMGSFGTHTVRIANKSNPSSCSTEGHSQTACGFVIEFNDVITSHRINPYEHNGQVNGDGQKGGWEYSEIRQYVNNDIYNALPEDLKSIIIDTYVVSGYGNADTAVFKTTDKLYYLSYTEIKGGGVYSNITDSGYSHQLEFYSNYSSNSSIAVKEMNNQPYIWCLRTPSKSSGGPVYYNTYYGVRSTNGFVDIYGACTGVSPAFRIG